MSILAQFVIAMLIFAAGGAAGIKWQVGIVAARDLKATQAAAREQFMRIERIDTAAVKHERFKVAAAVRERIVKEEVNRVVEKPVYLNSCLDDDGLRILADDIAARHAPTGKPAPAVPGTADADDHGRQRGFPVPAGSDPPVQRMREPARHDR